jgi:hypothetical protein
MKIKFARLAAAAMLTVAIGMLAACSGSDGKNGTNGSNGAPGTNAPTTGTIAGVVKDAGGVVVASAAISTVPTSTTVTSASDGTFTLANVTIGSYSVVASKSGYTTSTLPNVGVAASATTHVSLVLTSATAGTGTISGKVTDAKSPTPTPLKGVKVSVEGTSISTTTGADGSFALSGLPPGPVFLSAAAPSNAYLDSETKEAIFVQADGVVSSSLVLSARPDDTSFYIGVAVCAVCHTKQVADLQTSAHNRSLTRIARTPAITGPANSGAFARMLNATLATPRTVMVPLAGTISADGTSNVITGVSTLFLSGGAANALQVGDVIGYSATGLGWYKIGTVAAVSSDTGVTLAANATFAPAVTKVTGVKYSVARLSKTYSKMMPVDSGDVVAPAWPGVKATNPNYDPNDPCIYGAPASGTCAGGGSAQYADGQVNVYLCNLKGSTVQGVTYSNDEYVQKFGGVPYSCSDGTFYDGVTTPAVPMVHIDVIYGGQGDKDGFGKSHPNVGVFKQRFQGRLSDVKAAAAWNYTGGKNLDSLTLPIQVLESGDKVNGGFKMNGYHPTEQKFPGESWTQRTRTFSHGCAGCHNVGMTLEWDMVTVTLPFGRDGAPNNSPFTFAAVKNYGFIDENLTCEHCHGPGSNHVKSGTGKGVQIINPKYMTAEAQRQTCGKCHGYDDGTNAKPAQDYGFEFPWNSDYAAKLGGGDFIAGVYQLADFFDNWSEQEVDDEAYWDPIAAGGRLYGQAHRQQYTMLSQSTHVNNPYEKLTCTDCHDNHTLYLSSPTVQSAASDKYAFAEADFRNNVSCLTCHASYGPFAKIAKDDVANLHVGSGGLATKNGVAVVPSAEEITASNVVIANAVAKHMFDKASMVAPYQPLNDAVPAGRCTSCHMTKLAKSGGYTTGNDASSPANKALVEGDQSNHGFDIVWPWQSNGVLSRGGPTFQSGYYGQYISPTNVKYDQFGFMPNSCSKCHERYRTASLYCPDTATIWPSFWPFSEHRTDPYWASCYKSSTAP